MITNRPVSLADQVFERLENDILSGAYPRGTVLTEVKLCEALGVSRTPVREALRRLEQEHIVETRSKGILVLGISFDDARIIYSIREHIEGLAAAECAKHITEDELSELREITELQEFFTAKQESERIKELDSRFHSAIYRFTGSAVYYDALEPLHKKIQKFRRANVEQHGRAEQSTAEHRRIYSAIAAHDPAEAEKAMREHIAAAFSYLESIISARDNT